MRPGRIHQVILLACLAARASTLFADPVGEEFFTAKVEPLLRKRCFECHSHEKKIKGGLALDSRSGWEQGGEDGPELVAGAPEKSRIISAVRYEDKDLQMPPKTRLADADVAVLEQWVRMGAPDPRVSTVGTKAASNTEWESIYQSRLAWWSLQPVSKPAPPAVSNAQWPRNEIDRFILAALEAKGLEPAPEADDRTLARRLSFALTGLPPNPENPDASPRSFDERVQSFLDSPHFGEHWARHWMDVVHYSDTHGYEWDTPAKNAWMYRDYLIRAFNSDVPFKRLAMEQVAGDLLEPRVDAQTGVNESIIGPMAMRLGERRHGDNAMFEGITQEAMTNVIDTVSKSLLATTVACAQCHDHKLDAVAQRDYYALAGLFMSSRWGVRCADAVDPNVAVIDELRRLKTDIRSDLAKLWLDSRDEIVSKIRALPIDAPPKPATGFPESLRALWQRVAGDPAAWSRLSEDFARERPRRVAENQANLRLVADFTRDDLPTNWQVDGFGMKHGLAKDGEVVIANEGEAVIAQALPAGRWSHLWSARLAGALRSPSFNQQNPPTLSIGYAGGQFAAQSLIIDHSFHSERMKFIRQPEPGWLKIGTGLGQPERRVYFEAVTKSLNNYFPPRTGYEGVRESDVADERSWFGVTRVFENLPGKGPQDELKRFELLFAGEAEPSTKEEIAARLGGLVMAAVTRWSENRCNSEDVQLISEALDAKWLPNSSAGNPELAELVAKYRETERRIQPDRVIGSVADWNEGRDERIAIRGSYTDFGPEAPRGNIRFLGGATPRERAESSGRLEFAQGVASERNPLIARAFVNRVWLYLFGEGLVRTPDDFGHLGARPSHPELLDYLAARFMDEGWSLKKLVKLIVTSATWRQSGVTNRAALAADPENRLWHHMPMRRLEAEAIRDAMLAVSGRLDPALYGPPVDPYRTAQDPAKRLLSGPLDGDGRRSIYTKMTLMEPPRFLAIFNQPIPKVTVGRRDVTNVPDQALALLNDSFVIAIAKRWSEQLLVDGAETPEQRIQQMFATAFARSPKTDETARFVALAQRLAELRGADPAKLMHCQPVWQDLAHAVFNLKEFIYVP